MDLVFIKTIIFISSDLRAINKRAHVGYVHGKLGVSPGWNGGTHLVELLGRRVALRLMASAQMLNADQCMQLGMADFVYDNDQQLDAWISDFVSRTSTETIRASKRIVMNAVECSYVESLSRERDVFAELWGSPKHINALDSLEKK
jgi:ethylmalonyl-CoA/methylmalonyl-CoA decarboxylase